MSTETSQEKSPESLDQLKISLEQVRENYSKLAVALGDVEFKKQLIEQDRQKLLGAMNECRLKAIELETKLKAK